MNEQRKELNEDEQMKVVGGNCAYTTHPIGGWVKKIGHDVREDVAYRVTDWADENGVHIYVTEYSASKLNNYKIDKSRVLIRKGTPLKYSACTYEPAEPPYWADLITD